MSTTKLKTFEVELTASYELDEGQLWVEVNGVWHISPYLMDGKIWGKLSEGTLCGLSKIGYGREWGHRLVAGETVCSECVDKGKYTEDDTNNMQRFKLVRCTECGRDKKILKGTTSSATCVQTGEKKEAVQ